MAIDTAEKRRSAGSVPFLPWIPGVTPNSDKDAEWRAEALWGYSGLATSGVGGEVAATVSVAGAVAATATVKGSGNMLPIGADTYLKYYGASDSETGDYLNSGTCTYSLKSDDEATEYDSGSLSYVSGSNGNYRGTIDSLVTAGLTEGTRYVIIITFDQGAYEDVRRIYERAGYRGRT